MLAIGINTSAKGMIAVEIVGGMVICKIIDKIAVVCKDKKEIKQTKIDTDAAKEAAKEAAKAAFDTYMREHSN